MILRVGIFARSILSKPRASGDDPAIMENNLGAQK